MKITFLGSGDINNDARYFFMIGKALSYLQTPSKTTCIAGLKGLCGQAAGRRLLQLVRHLSITKTVRERILGWPKIPKWKMFHVSRICDIFGQRNVMCKSHRSTLWSLTHEPKLTSPLTYYAYGVFDGEFSASKRYHTLFQGYFRNSGLSSITQ